MENPNKVYIQFNRLIGMSTHGNVLCVDRDLNGTLAGPVSAGGMMNDLEHMLQLVLRALPEYASIRITFEVLDREEYVVDDAGV
jgi:hypothetical protein